MSKSDVAIVIPWRSTGADREAALKRTLAALDEILPEAETIFADSGHESRSRSWRP